MGLVLAGWSLIQPYFNVIEWFVVPVSVMLILNGIFSRCYLWYVLDIDTSGADYSDTSAEQTLPLALSNGG